ncbi:hypothetical protein DIPPA_33579 [Diplonema papillatum]|nr:hypothetical protein DIPPA_33579 [Diplonema papillatum]
MFFGASCGGSVYDSNPLIHEELSVILLEERNQVCFTWLVTRCGTTREAACRALQQFAEAYPKSVKPTYMIEGIAKDTRLPACILVELPYPATEGFQGTPSVSVYSLTPIPDLLPAGPAAPEESYLCADADMAPASPVSQAASRGCSVGFSARQSPSSCTKRPFYGDADPPGFPSNPHRLGPFSKRRCIASPVP